MTQAGMAADEKFEALLDYLRHNRGFDFTGYRRSSLVRRVSKRMQMVDVSDFADYIDYLQVHPDEFVHLFNTILINVTSFFRDPESWEFLAETVLPRILRGHAPHEQIRVWCAGAASGQEAYTIAILLAEALGDEAFREQVTIYATDVDEEALMQARDATYSEQELEPVPGDLRERYFEMVGARYAFRGELRRSVIFERHDLIQDAPISRLDLLICRNTLMYFNAETQSHILARFHLALSNDGYLFVGKAEMLLTHAAVFAPLDLSHRVFVKVPKAGLGERVATVFEIGNLEPIDQVGRHVRLRDAAFDAGQTAQLVGDELVIEPNLPDIEGVDPASQLRPAVDLVPAIIWTTDRKLRITSIAGAGLDSFGLRPGTAVDELGPAALAAHRRAVEGEQVAYEMTRGGRRPRRAWSRPATRAAQLPGAGA